MTPPDSSYSALLRLVEVAGGQAALSRAIGCTQGAVWQMIHKTKRLSLRFVIVAEAATGISRHELRPDIFGPIPPAPADPAATPDRFEAAR